MEKDYTREAQMAAEAYVKAHPYFHGPVTAMDSDVDFSLKDATDLIKTAAVERQQALRRIEAQQELAQARENVSLLPDREAEKIQAEWREQSRLQAQNYCDARNRHLHPRSTQGVDSDLLQSTLSWIKRTKMRGGLGGRKALDTN